MTDISYCIAPFLGYTVAGGLKFLINTIKHKKLAFKQMGLGGMPSTHNTVTSTMTTLVCLNEGMTSPIFGISLTLTFIVALDSMGLRAHIQKHAEILSEAHQAIRKKIAHTPMEAVAGMALGILCATVLYNIKGIIGS